MPVQNLQVWEVDEATRLHLSKEDYDFLKTNFLVRYKKSPEGIQEHENLEAEVRRRLTPELRVEVAEEISKKLTEDFEKNAKANLRKEIEKEIAQEAPTPQLREATRDVVRNIEIEALTFARATADLAHRLEQETLGQRQWRQRLLLIVAFGLPLVLMFLHLVVRWDLVGMPFLTSSGLYLLAVIVLWVKSNPQAKEIVHLREVSLGYRRQAEEARDARIVGVDAAMSKSALMALTTSYRSYNSNQQIVLAPADIDLARQTVKEGVTAYDRLLPGPQIERIWQPGDSPPG